ncbi:AAA ATPase midasin [Coemansia spiralis]|uniref:AAA ATPase midasin n=1 Tax=Coemansia spiralis TaxID=417178 RepID=A0A9W8GGS0_9FUNG|nr:AAA ATPase midasin [Coemansia spiralis]
MEQSIAGKRAAARGHNNESRLAGNEEEAAGDMSEQAMQLWQAYMWLSHGLSSMLAKQLRLIPHIASEFRNGKIWLRRTKPARHEYQVTIALNQPEVGRLSVVSFGKSVSTLHPFDHPFNANAEPRNGAANSECSTSPSAHSVDNTKVKDSFVSTSAASSAAASSVATPPTTASTLLATAAGASSTRTLPVPNLANYRGIVDFYGLDYEGDLCSEGTLRCVLTESFGASDMVFYYSYLCNPSS